MNPQFFDKSAMGTAWQAQQQQPFGKDNLRQVFTTERIFPHEHFLASCNMSNVFDAMPRVGLLWKEYERVKDIDWTPLCISNPDWKIQKKIDDERVDMRTAMKPRWSPSKS
jgi:hypothetical protein